jgi:hypothetical protein
MLVVITLTSDKHLGLADRGLRGTGVYNYRQSGGSIKLRRSHHPCDFLLHIQQNECTRILTEKLLGKWPLRGPRRRRITLSWSWSCET